MLPILSRPPLINSLHERLAREPLPGLEAHLKMAHPIRKADPGQASDIQKEAAVLITLFEKTPGDLHLIFIRRGSSHEQDKHAGQIGFPGGKKEPSDPDMIFTALREAEEEIALDLTLIDVLGPLTPLYINVSKFLVHPYVSFAWEPPILTRQESEIEEILELPLAEFRTLGVRQETRIQLSTGITLNHVPCFLVNGHVIWGATAMIMNELLEILS
ncbi:MAG TPA: CoA pyrophosphatase [Saprospiraceae bacterium]|nr:CoA pyrophosphatase [Saprospiraceae bacterium]